MACLATARRRRRAGGLLHGAANALLEAHGGAWESPEKEYRDDDIANLRVQLDTDFDRLYDKGRTAPHEEIAELALGRNSPLTT